MCECPIAGFCSRHNVYKHEGWRRLCQTRPDYFRQWEEGIGPGQYSVEAVQQSLRFKFGAGDVVYWTIRIITLGYVKPCRTCKSRMAWLNYWFPLWPIDLRSCLIRLGSVYVYLLRQFRL